MSYLIRNLLDEPFGPYPDSFLLNPAFVPKGINLPRLRRLRLVQNERFIGLDTSEQYLAAPTVASNPILFLGVLVIEKLDWLSEAGVKCLTIDLNDRDEEWARNVRGSLSSRKSMPSRTPLTLTGLYGQTPAKGFKIKVWIQCQKDVPAMYMTEKDYKGSLLLGSRDRRRSYEILSIDRQIYDSSRKFLRRYQLVALIKETIQIPEYRLPENGVNLDVLVQAYLRKHKGESLSHSVIFSEDVETTPATPRLRHLSRAEIRGVIAAHAEWLLAFYLLPHKTCPLDVIAWCDFIRKVWIARAAPGSGNWGKTSSHESSPGPNNNESNEAIAKALAVFGETPDFWKKRLDLEMTKKNPSSTTLHVFEDDTHLPPGRWDYDPEFSEPSTPGETTSDSDSDSDRLPLPHSMYKTPTLLPGRFIWDCPLAKCGHSIDLLNLTPQYTFRDIYVRKKQYETLADEQVQQLLFQMVSDHFYWHLGELTKYRSEAQFKAELAERWKKHKQKD